MLLENFSVSPYEDALRVKDYLEHRVLREVSCEDEMDALSTEEFESRLAALSHISGYLQRKNKQIETLKLKVDNLSAEKAAVLKKYVTQVTRERRYFQQ